MPEKERNLGNWIWGKTWAFWEREGGGAAQRFWVYTRTIGRLLNQSVFIQRNKVLSNKITAEFLLTHLWKNLKKAILDVHKYASFCIQYH